MLLACPLANDQKARGMLPTCKLQDLIQAALCTMHNPALVASSRKARGTGTPSRQERAPLAASGHSLTRPIPSTGVSAGPVPLIAIAADNGDHESTFEVMWALPSHPSSMSGPWVKALGHGGAWDYRLITRRTQIKRSSWVRTPTSPSIDRQLYWERRTGMTR